MSDNVWQNLVNHSNTYVNKLNNFPSAFGKRLLTGGIWAFSGKIFFILSTLAVNALLARILSPEALGTYFLTFSLVTVSSVIAQQGLNLTIVRLVAESLSKLQPEKAAKSIRLTFLLGGIGATIVAFILIFGLGEWLAKNTFNSIKMLEVVGYVAFWVVITTLQNLSAETFRGFHDIRFATIFGGLFSSLLSALLFFRIWALNGHCSLGDAILISITAGFTSTLIASFILIKKHNSIKGDCDLPIKEVLNISLPLWLTSLVFLLLSQADLWVLGIFSLHKDVAIYGAALRLVALVTMPLLIVNAVVQPLISEMYAKGQITELEKILRFTATFAAVPAFFIFIIFVFFGNFVLGAIYGDYYREGAIVLSILSLGQMINVGVGSCGLVLMMTGNQSRMMFITLISGVVTVTGCVASVRLFGFVGVASAATLGIAMHNLLILRAVHQKIKIWTYIRLPLRLLLLNEKT